MGVYLNGRSAYGLFRRDCASAYFVDKTEILAELVPLVELDEKDMEEAGPKQGKGQKYVAITRPRRFGKTVMANMAAAYFGRGSNPADERPSCPVGYQTGELIWEKESTAVFPKPMKSNLKDGKRWRNLLPEGKKTCKR